MVGDPRVRPASVAAVYPHRRRGREIVPDRGDSIGQLGIHDQVRRRREIEAMGQRWPRKLRADEGGDAAGTRDAEP